MNRACEAQLRLIAQHRERLGVERGEEVSQEFAARDWIAKYAALWRQWWESHESDSNAVPSPSPPVAESRELAAG